MVLVGQQKFIPPTVKPPHKQLPLPALIYRLIRNPIEAWGQEFYHQPLVELQHGSRQTVFVLSSDLIHKVLVADSENFSKNPVDKRILAQALGNGILLAEGDEWRWQRRTAAPLFRHDVVMDCIPTMAAAADRLLESWKSDLDDDVRPIDHEMSLVTFDIIQETLLKGRNAFDGQLVAGNISRYLQPISWLVAYDFLRLPNWMPHPGMFKMQRSARILRQEVLNLVRSRKDDAERSEDLLAKLLSARDPETGKSMPESLVVDNLLTFLAAGHETTALALTWSLFLIASVPEWQQRIYEEVVNVAGDRPVSADMVNRLPQTQNVIKEALRLYPPASIVSRQAIASTEIGNIRVKKNAIVMMPIFIIHRHYGNWRDPEIFDPNRFAPENDVAREKFAFMPFGTGKRSCIGATFAMTEAQVILATLVRKVWFETTPATHPKPLLRVTLRPDKGLPLKIRFR